MGSKASHRELRARRGVPAGGEVRRRPRDQHEPDRGRDTRPDSVPGHQERRRPRGEHGESADAMPDDTQATRSPGSRDAARFPATAPKTAPTKTTPQLDERGAAQDRGARNRCEEHVRHVGWFEGEWPAAASRAQPGSHRDGDHQAECGRPVTAGVGELDVVTWSVPKSREPKNTAATAMIPVM